MSFATIKFPLDTFATIEWEEDGVVGKRSVLPGGLRVISENIPGQRSTSVSFWIGAGSRDEQLGHEGSTHFLEHLLFKGTSKRTSADISKLSDYLGGAINAATSRQYTCYYGRVFSADLPKLLDLLVDMITDSILDPAQMEIERTVILEELAASADDANEAVETALLPLVLGDHPLSRPVGGTKDTVNQLKHEQMLAHYRGNYAADELVVTAAGDVNHADLCEQLLNLLSAAGWDLTLGKLPAARRKVADIQYQKGTELILPHQSRQAAVVVGMPSLANGSEQEAEATILDIILGGGTSSRLFQEVREQRGLAYSVYSWSLNWNEGGVFAMEAACAPENTEQVAQIMRESLSEVAKNGVTEDELQRAQNQRRTQLVFAAETNGFRKNRLGHAELIRGELTSIAESLSRTGAVTAEKVQELAAEYAKSSQSVVRSQPN